MSPYDTVMEMLDDELSVVNELKSSTYKNALKKSARNAASEYGAGNTDAARKNVC